PSCTPRLSPLSLHDALPISEPRDRGRPLPGQLVHVEIVRAAPAPVQRHREIPALRDHLLHDRLDRREAGPAREQHDRGDVVLAQEEGAHRPFEAEDVAHLDGRTRRAEERIGEPSAGQVPDVQLQGVGLAGRGRHRVGAPGSVAQDQLDVLAGEIAQGLPRRQLQAQDDDVGRDPFDRIDAAGQLAHGDVADTGHEPRLHHQRRTGARAAHQCESGRPLVGIERGGRMRALLHLAFEHARLAGAADAVLAPVRHDHRLAQCRIEDALVGSRIELAAARQYPDPETHRLSVPAPYHCRITPVHHYRPMRKSSLRPVLPRRLRRPRLLLVGCGDVGGRLAQRLLARMGDRWKVIGTARSEESLAAIRALGAVPIAIDLDAPRSARRIAGLASRIVHLAPPQPAGRTDARSRRLVAAIGGAARPGGRATLVYCGTTGVYGDAAGARLDETRPVAPRSERAQRRASAERQLRALARRGMARVALLRAPGIYAHDRLPTERLRRGTPAIVHAEDSYSSHIHADDLAQLLWLALFRAGNCRAYNAVDSAEMRMGEWF